MSDITRRDAISHLAKAFAAAAAFDHLVAREVHAAVAQARVASGGTYVSKALSGAQFKTLNVLVDAIIPVEGGKPGAVQAGVPEWIDSLLAVNAELRFKYAAGLGWLDSMMQTRGGSDFVSATSAQRTALLDLIAFKKNASPDLDHGIEFFALARRMTVDGFYTSDVGLLDINPSGRPPMPQYIVPQASVDYVISRSPFK